MADQKLASEAEKRSNVESLGLQEGTDFQGGHTHSGEGRLVENLVLFIPMMLVFCAGIYALGMYPDGGWVWWMIAMAGMLIPWGVVYHLVSSKTNRSVRQNGTELTQL